MSTTQVNQNLIQLTRWRFVNAFLVREDDGFTLVDTTVSGGADELIAAARSAGGDIRRIALTHGHGDHVGSLDALKEQLGDSRFPLAAMATWDKGKDLESARKLRELEPAMLVVG